MLLGSGENFGSKRAGGTSRTIGRSFGFIVVGGRSLHYY